MKAGVMFLIKFQVDRLGFFIVPLITKQNPKFLQHLRRDFTYHCKEKLCNFFHALRNPLLSSPTIFPL